MSPKSPGSLPIKRTEPKRKEDVVYRSEIIREDWPLFIGKVVEAINSEQDGFNFKVYYDRVGEFYILESENDIYLHFRIVEGRAFIVKNIFAIEKGQGYGKMLMDKIIQLAKKNGIHRIVADNVSPTLTAYNFWRRLGFREVRENRLNMDLYIK